MPGKGTLASMSAWSPMGHEERFLDQRMKVPQVDAAGTSNSTKVRLTRQKSTLFQWLAIPLRFPKVKIVCQQIRGHSVHNFAVAKSLTQSLSRSRAAWHSKMRADPAGARHAP